MITDLSHVTDKLYHIMFNCYTPICSSFLNICLGSLRPCTKDNILLALSWGWRYFRKVDDSQLCIIVYTCKDCEIKKNVYIIIRLLFICLFVIMLKILGKNTCVLKPAMYSNGKRQWRVIVMKKKIKNKIKGNAASQASHKPG